MAKSQINQEEWNRETEEQLKKHGRDIDWMKYLTVAVGIVLFIGFLACVMALGQIYFTYLSGKQASYDNLANQVYQQNFKIDQLQATIDSKLK